MSIDKKVLEVSHDKTFFISPIITCQIKVLPLKNYFINITGDELLLNFGAKFQRKYNNFEISLVVFMPNITTNHAITYTNL